MSTKKASFIQRPARIVFGLGLFGVCTVVALGVLFPERVDEEWQILRLKYGEADTRTEAALELGQLRSKRAIPALYEALEGEASAGRRIEFLAITYGRAPIWTDSAIVKALTDIGEPARRFLAQRVPESADVDSGSPPEDAVIQLVDITGGPAEAALVLKALVDGGAVEYSQENPSHRLQRIEVY